MTPFTDPQLEAIRKVARKFGIAELTAEDKKGKFLDSKTRILIDCQKVSEDFKGLPVIGITDMMGSTDEFAGRQTIDDIRAAIQFEFDGLPKKKKFEPKVEHDSSTPKVDKELMKKISDAQKENKDEQSQDKSKEYQKTGQKGKPEKTQTDSVEKKISGTIDEANHQETKEPEPVNPKEKKMDQNLPARIEPEHKISIAHSQRDIIENAISTSKLLVNVIDKGKLFSMISGKKYVRVEGWETLGALLLCSSEIIKTDEYKNGYKAEAIIKNQDGKIIANGVGICLRTEKNWATRDDFAICSMAQTRAIGKAYRLGFAWIMSLAGYEVCPAEEMDVV